MDKPCIHEKSPSIHGSRATERLNVYAKLIVIQEGAKNFYIRQHTILENQPQARCLDPSSTKLPLWLLNFTQRPSRSSTSSLSTISSGAVPIIVTCAHLRRHPRLNKCISTGYRGLVLPYVVPHQLVRRSPKFNSKKLLDSYYEQKKTQGDSLGVRVYYLLMPKLRLELFDSLLKWSDYETYRNEILSTL